ncbi:MAG: InlB B-repeat-containing protein, partial [Treponema sp.]|nr:InlB B-repeat-containing protein [Treponema sp.]
MSKKTAQGKKAPQILVYGIFIIILALAFTACDDLFSIDKFDNTFRPDDQKGSGAPDKDLPESKTDNAVPEYRNITWNLNGGTADPQEYPTQIVKGGKLDEPVNNPVKYYSQFIGWYRDSELKYAYTFTNSRVNDNLALYAKWEAIGVTITPPKEGSWKQWSPSYNKSYSYLMEKNYNGTIFYASGAVFSATVKDADDQTVIWKIEGENGEELDDGTTIDDGTLFVAAPDHGKKVIITATSMADDKKLGYISVIAVQWSPSDFSAWGSYWTNNAGYSLQFNVSATENDYDDYTLLLNDSDEGFIHLMRFYFIPAMNRNNEYADEYITGYTVYSTWSSCAPYSYLSRIGFLAVSEGKQTLYLGEDTSSFYNFDNDDY